MRIHILGSGAAEGWPAVYCRCNACQRARARGGRSIRSRSATLVDGRFQFDWSSDAYMQGLRDGVALSDVRHLIFTHTHRDHYYPSELVFRRPPFAHQTLPLTIWADAWAIEGIREEVGDLEAANITLCQVEPFQTYQLDDALLTPLLANHFPERSCFNYIFERNGKRLLYGQDSGWFPEEHWQAQQGLYFDVVVLDCTGGPKDAGQHHGNIDLVIRSKERMIEMGTADDDTLFIANHFSHNGGLLHEELVELLSPHGIDVSYDGMIVEV